MADKLNQVGKRLKKNQDSTRYNLSRYSRHFPKIERSRDSFTSVLPFSMEFPSVAGQKTRITFNFANPLPTGTTTGTFYEHSFSTGSVGGPPASNLPLDYGAYSLPFDLPSFYRVVVTGVLVTQNGSLVVDGTLHQRFALYDGSSNLIAKNNGFGSEETEVSWGNHYDTHAVANMVFDHTSGLVAGSTVHPYIENDPDHPSSDGFNITGSALTFRIYGITDS